MGATGEPVTPLGWWAYAVLGAAWFGVAFALGAAGFDGAGVQLSVTGVFLAAFGVLCLANGRSCGAVHCKITGPGYIALAGLAFLGALGWIGFAQREIMMLFGVLTAAAFLLEWVLGRREIGSAS